MVRREFDGGTKTDVRGNELFRLSGGQPGDTPAIREAQARQAAEMEAKRQAQREALRAVPRAFADLRQFPRPGLATDYARKHGFPPWARESLTYSEARGGSIFGFGLIDNPIDTSPGERRVAVAKLHNGIRAQVRAWIDEGRTDEQIKVDLASAALPGGGNFLFDAAFPDLFKGGSPVPTDIRSRFKL